MNLIPISPGLFPNVQKDDIFLALSTLFSPYKWKDTSPLIELSGWFEKNFSAKRVYLFNAGRSALYLLLKSAGIGEGDEVIVQAFTCVGAVEPILWAGAKPVYADIKRDTFNINPSDLQYRLTKKTKAIIVQHTFGIPADINKIAKFARKNNLLLIEDCAHSLGAEINGKKVGTFGDAAFFSFGRDKIISSTFGGAAVVHNSFKFKNIDNFYKKLNMPDAIWIIQQLLHPLSSIIVLPTYRLQLGKIFLILLQRLKLLGKPYKKIEYYGEKPKNYPQKLPSPIARLALNQLRKLKNMNKKRRDIASKYGKLKKGAVYLRYPCLVENPGEFYNRARKSGIFLGRWYSNIIDPLDTDLKIFGYKKGSCPVAEKTAKQIINLPTYPRMSCKDLLQIKNQFFSKRTFEKK